MTKYREYFIKMLEDHKSLFEEFKILHDRYGLEGNALQEKFNVEGKKILEIVHEYENRLCANTERGMYNKFSGGLSEKFQAEVRKYLPLIDHVGLIVEPEFAIRKINLGT